MAPQTSEGCRRGAGARRPETPERLVNEQGKENHEGSSVQDKKSH